MEAVVMKKTFSESGRNGTFTGFVVVSLNYRTYRKDYNNHVTQDEDGKMMYVHKVEAYLDAANLFCSVAGMETDVDLDSSVAEIESKLIDFLQMQANSNLSPSLEEKLFSKGYK